MHALQVNFVSSCGFTSHPYSWCKSIHVLTPSRVIQSTYLPLSNTRGMRILYQHTPLNLILNVHYSFWCILKVWLVRIMENYNKMAYNIYIAKYVITKTHHNKLHMVAC